ncbi:hypothetical protein H1235_10080 [Pseudoxanthomonas sp. NC8]|nr:hypothetical protein H1235_10080 [Pseudoxanthomonas sp. NC8]
MTGTDAAGPGNPVGPVATTDPAPLVRPVSPQVLVNLRNGASLRFDRAEVRTPVDTAARPGAGATTRPRQPASTSTTSPSSTPGWSSIRRSGAPPPPCRRCREAGSAG